jgi:hypothetical protein
MKKPFEREWTWTDTLHSDWNEFCRVEKECSKPPVTRAVFIAQISANGRFVNARLHPMPSVGFDKPGRIRV